MKTNLFINNNWKTDNKIVLISLIDYRSYELRCHYLFIDFNQKIEILSNQQIFKTL